jgi:hypothetical protein
MRYRKHPAPRCDELGFAQPAAVAVEAGWKTRSNSSNIHDRTARAGEDVADLLPSSQDIYPKGVGRRPGAVKL